MVSLTLTPLAPWQAAHTPAALALPASMSAACASGAMRTSAIPSLVMGSSLRPMLTPLIGDSHHLSAQVEHDAGELTRPRRGEKAHRVADLLGLDDVADQLLVAAFIAELGLGLRLHQRDDAIRPGRRRMHADDAHAVLARALAHGLGERGEAGVGRGAAHVLERMRLARHADDVDDDAALARLHARIELARQVDEAEHLKLPRVAPLRLVERLDRAARDVAGVVDQDIDAGALFGEPPERRAVAQIDRMRLHFATEAPRRLRQAILVARGEVNTAAFGSERLGACEANAFRAAGD